MLLCRGSLSLQRVEATLWLRCAGFSCCRAWTLGRSGVSSCSTWAWGAWYLWHAGLAALLQGMWDLPGPGFEPLSPALQGRLLTTGPPQEPLVPSIFTCADCIMSASPTTEKSAQGGRALFPSVLPGLEESWAQGRYSVKI